MRDEPFRILDSAIYDGGRLIVAYSGGKDSTALSLMLYDWIMSRGARDVEVVLANSDTLSEIPAMREWTIEFMRWYVEKLREVGIEASYAIYTPEPTDTFYWRVLVRGYPAPTFSFRWCVKLLKREPVKRLVGVAGSVLLLGHRDEESPARARSLKRRLGFCPLSAGRCASHYLQIEGNVKKLYPIRELSEEEVWSYLYSREERSMLEKLFALYGYGVVKARYGCWHCTLVKRQLAHYLLGGEYMYFEAARLIYKWISDVPELRARKDRGYSRLGCLLRTARATLLHVIQIAEKLSGLKFYGLDEARVGGYTLREIFYVLEPKEADKVISSVEATKATPSDRLVSMEELRHPTNRGEVLKIVNLAESRAGSLDGMAQKRVSEVLSRLEELAR